MIINAVIGALACAIALQVIFAASERRQRRRVDLDTAVLLAMTAVLATMIIIRTVSH